MREIKFRAWDTLNKIMVYEMFMFRKAESYDNVQTDYVYYNEFRDFEDGIARPCEIMQFTGLLDKNGREIYEGDLIKTHDEIVKVYFNEAMACFDIEYDGGDTEPLVQPMGEWVEQSNEIIGNIHENPELIA